MIKNEFNAPIIAFCGVDGAGKSTLLNATQKYLENSGIGYYSTKMPSNRIREMDVFRTFHDSHDHERRKEVSAFPLTVLVSGDRLIVQETEVVPNLKKGLWVLSDRYVFSGMACSNNKIIEDISENFIQPELVILADCSPETAMKRVKNREEEKKNFYDYEDSVTKINRFRAMSHKYSFFTRISTEQSMDDMLFELEQQLNKTVNNVVKRHKKKEARET